MNSKLFLILLALGILGSAVIVHTIEAKIAPAPIIGQTQAVCNVSPTPEGKYTKAGCEEAFNRIPRGALPGCLGNLRPVLQECLVTKGDDVTTKCTNNEGTLGKWCTCYYTCELPRNK